MNLARFIRVDSLLIFWGAALGFFVPVQLAEASAIGVQGDLTPRQQLTAGEAAAGKVVVVNPSPAVPVVAQVTLRNMVPTPAGVEFQPLGSFSHSNASWLTVQPLTFQLEPGGSQPLSWTVQVPPKTEPGTYWSTLLVEPELSGLEVQPKASKVGVITVVRYAVTIITDVLGGPHAIELGQRQLVATSGSPMLELELINHGRYLEKPSVFVEAQRVGGETPPVRINAPVKALYPNSTARVEVPLGDLPQGQYSLLLVADIGDGSPIGAQYAVELR